MQAYMFEHPPTQDVSCAQRHTAENIKRWTKEALESIGLTPAKLLAE